MAKKQDYKPFPGVNCQRIRNLQALITATEKSRDDSFAARDHALDQIHACGAAEAEKLARLRGDHSVAVCDIESHAKTIKWARKELASTIENADEASLFDNADIEVPDWDAESKADDGDTRPIGEPAAPTDTIDAYLPGRFKDQDGEECNINNMDHLRVMASKHGPNVDIEPRISPTLGCSIEFVQLGRVVQSFTYIGKAKGRKAG